MKPRERVLAALSHKETDIIPFSFGFGVNYPAKKAFAEYMKKDVPEIDALFRTLSDIQKIEPRYIGPKDRNITMSDGSHVDIWGVKRSPAINENDTYLEISEHPLRDCVDIIGLESYLFPKVEWFDFTVIPELIKAYNGNYAIMFTSGNIFESAWYLRGLEQMFADILLEKEFSNYLLCKVTNFFLGFTRKMLEVADGKIDLAFTADDIGGQNGLLLSLSLWEEIIKPHHQLLNKTIHEYGAKVVYHTDGAVMEALDGLIDMGIDILEALQFDAKGMDPTGIKERAGNRLCFHGGVSVQSTLPFGTIDDVEREVDYLVKTLGKNSGYILAPSHAVQAGTPPENIFALLKAAGRLY